MSSASPPGSPAGRASTKPVSPQAPQRKPKPARANVSPGRNIDHDLAVAAGVTQQMPGGRRRRRRKSKRKSHKKSHKKRRTKKRRKSRKKKSKRRRRR